MGLNLNRLEKVVELAGGAVRARCPACAEGGQDRKGEHLRISPEGKFGCCVFPGDREHRKRIFALAGDHGRQGIQVRVAALKVAGVVQGGILGRLGRVFATPATVAQSSDASDGVSEVQPQVEEARTPRTGVLKSSDGPRVGDELPLEESRTPRTPVENSRVYAERILPEEEDVIDMLKEFRGGVRSVREGEAAVEPPLELEEGVRSVRTPYFTSGGTLVIPFDSPERYHWWKGGQSIAETRVEIAKH